MLNINAMTSCCGVLPDIQRQENVRKVVKEGAVLFHLHSVMSLTSDFPIVNNYKIQKKYKDTLFRRFIEVLKGRYFALLSDLCSIRVFY